MTQKAPPHKGWKSTKQAGAESFEGGGKSWLSSCFSLAVARFPHLAPTLRLLASLRVAANGFWRFADNIYPAPAFCYLANRWLRDAVAVGDAGLLLSVAHAPADVQDGFRCDFWAWLACVGHGSTFVLALRLRQVFGDVEQRRGARLHLGHLAIAHGAPPVFLIQLYANRLSTEQD